jgi:hypothetical protein
MRNKEYRLKPHEAIALGLELRISNRKDANPKYPLTDDQHTELLILRNFHSTQFKEVKRTIDKDGFVISKVEKLTPSDLIKVPQNHQIKRVSTNVSTQQQWVITEPIKGFDAEDIDFESIIKKFIFPIITEVKEVKNIYSFDRLVFTDVHIGMTPNQNGFSLYGGKWDEDEIFVRCEKMIEHALQNKKSNVLIVDDLGDFVDGWDGYTTRQGHKLPQNMDNEKAFEVGLRFKMMLCDAFVNVYDKVIFHNVCNDNHSGSFAYVINHAFKSICDVKYSNVVICNFRKFIDHYTIEKRCFIITHGKDSKALKFGFKPKLDPVQIEKIKGYIDQHKLHEYEIEFSKGDSHQKLFDESTSDAFDYYNYGALSSSSEWIQTNFKKGKSFFEFFNFLDNGNKIHNPYKFEWNINREETYNKY